MKNIYRWCTAQDIPVVMKFKYRKDFLIKDNLSKKAYDKTMAQNYVYEHPWLRTNYLENLFSDIERTYIPKIDKCVDYIEQQYLSGMNYNHFILGIKELLPIFMIFI